MEVQILQQFSPTIVGCRIYNTLFFLNLSWAFIFIHLLFKQILVATEDKTEKKFAKIA